MAKIVSFSKNIGYTKLFVMAKSNCLSKNIVISAKNMRLNKN